MAYAAAVTYSQERWGGSEALVVTVVETGVTAGTDEYTISVPAWGRLVYHKATLTVGDGAATTIDPIVQEATGTTSTDNVFTNGAAAAVTRNIPSGAVFHAPARLLYCRSTADNNTGTTGYITTRMVFVPEAF